MKRAAVFFFLIALPGVVFAEGRTRRMIVATRHPANEAMQRLRGDDFDPSNRIRYNAYAFKYINAFVADLDESEIAALKKSPEVVFIEPDVERHAFAADTITAGVQTTAYGMNLVKAPQAWPITKGRSIDPSKPIRVVVIDTGIDYTSPELSDNYKGGRDVVNGDDDPVDDAGHGTHVAGIVAAADNGQGVVGVAPQVEIYAVKVLDSCGSGSGSNVIRALEWVRDKKRTLGGNWIVNLSLGSNTVNLNERNAFAAAQADGILSIAASGNDFEDHPTTIAFPAGYPSVVSVGSVGKDSAVSYFSQRGVDLKVVAPGGPGDPSASDAIDSLILSTFVGEQVSTNDGRHFTATLPTPVDENNETVESICMEKPIFSGPFVFCGFGGPSEFPASVNGKVALISRGSGITFLDKAKNAHAAGAIGVIIYNNQPPDAPEGQGRISPSLAIDPITGLLPPIPPLVMLLQPDGESLRATANATVNVAFDEHGFGLQQGTSMASPHAAGIAALAWSVAPNMKNTEIADALQKTAKDLGTPGVDNTFGFGLLDAKAVVDLVNTSNPVQPSKPTGRIPGRR
jgi:subtilisin family serine protease